MTDRPSPAAGAASPLRVAVVGAGPSGFYATLDLLADESLGAHVDLFDHLPTPYGLVRYGVAPDHVKIKSVTKVFDRGVERAGSRYRFFGNVTLGEDVSLGELMERYHAVILAYGAQGDRDLGIPGENLHGVYAAREFVAWYNCHPDYSEAEFDLQAEHGMVVGIGNVAIDVARILSRTPEELRATDINERTIDAVARSALTRIDVVARRGPAQAACTPVELRELCHMEASDLVVSERDLELDPVSRSLIETGRLDTQSMRNVEIMRTDALRGPRDGRDSIRLAFYLSPIEILGTERVEAVRLRRNTLLERDDGRVVVQATDETFDVPCQVVFRSIGYEVEPLPGVPFDERRYVTPHDRGQVLVAPGGEPVQGLFVAGWLKRGPSGVIGTNKPDAGETVETLLAAYGAGRLAPPREQDIVPLLQSRDVRYVSQGDWLLLDQYELAAGAAEGRPRKKMCTVPAMLAAIDAAKAAALPLAT